VNTPRCPEAQVTAHVADPSSVDLAISSRFSTRAFFPDPVPRALIEEVLAVARNAPSGTNTQPWKVYVVQGAKRDEIVQAACAAHDARSSDPALDAQLSQPYDYYPSQWFSPYLDRRRECGFGLYAALGIGKGDKARMHAQHQRNLRFFDAPVGLFFTIDQKLGRGSLLDYGMFLQSVMVAARARGLHTCPQAAWNEYQSLVLPRLGAAEEEMMVCGMSLGHADPADPANAFQTTRVPVADFSRWFD